MTQPQETSEKRPPDKWYTRTQSEIDLLLSMQHRKRSGITINPTESEEEVLADIWGRNPYYAERNFSPSDLVAACIGDL